MATELQDMLDTFTEAVIQGQENPDDLLRQYNLPQEKIDGLLDLIVRLQASLVERRPSGKFIKQLQQELVGRERRLSLPKPVWSGKASIVAGIAAFACAGAMGIILILRRHLLDDAADRSEVPL